MRRPAVVVGNDRANAVAARLGRGVVTLVPVAGRQTPLADCQFTCTKPER